jgi:hypothetical protein
MSNKCEWRFIVPGVWRAGCNVQRIFVPLKNQIRAKDFRFCPFCGATTTFVEYCNPPNRFIGRLPGRFSAWQCDDDADLPDAYHPERGWLILNEDGTWKYSTENQEVNDDPACK